MNQEDAYIISESPEILSTQEANWTKRLRSAFPALTHRNYRFYFGGQLVSLIGTWLQSVAQGYLVYNLTQSAFWVGLIAALNFIPVMIFALFGGVVVDRYNKRTILYITQTSQMILAFLLGIFTLLGIINANMIAVFAFFLGISNALDMPARQTFINEIVDKKNLSSAISLNAGMFNAARVIGPAGAGLLIAYTGVGGAFIINGLSFIAVIFALYCMKLQVQTHDDHPHPFDAIKEGITYAWHNKLVRSLLGVAATLSIFGWSYATIMPVIAKEVFHVGAAGLGYLQAASGLGAVVGAVVVSSMSGRVKSFYFIFIGTFLFITALLVFSLVRSMSHAYIALFFSGFGLIMSFATMNSTIQHTTDMRIRGRVMSIYTLMFIGMTPIGNIELGYLTQVYGSSKALQCNAIVLLIILTLLFVTRKELREVHVK